MPLSTEPFAPAMCSQCSGTLHVIGKGWACGQCGLPVDEPKSQPAPVAAAAPDAPIVAETPASLMPDGSIQVAKPTPTTKPKRGRKSKV